MDGVAYYSLLGNCEYSTEPSENTLRGNTLELELASVSELWKKLGDWMVLPFMISLSAV